MAKNTAEDMVKEQNAIAGEWVLNYHARLKEYGEMCANFSVLAGTVCDDMPHSTDTGDPCSKKAVALAKINEYKAWLEVVELAESTLSEQKRMFICFKRLALDINFKDTNKTKGRPPILAYISAKYCEWYCRRYGVANLPGTATMAVWWEIISNVTSRIAIEKHLYK